MDAPYVLRGLMPIAMGGNLLDLVSDESLLAGETDGLAVDFTDTTYFDEETGDQDWVQERNASVDTLQSPHVFFTQSGTSPKYVRVSATGIGWSPHNLVNQSETPGSWTPSGTITVSGQELTAGAGGSDHALQGASVTLISGRQYTLIVDVTFVNHNFFSIGFSTNTNFCAVAVYDLSVPSVSETNTLGSGYVINGTSITDLGSSQYRVTLTATIGGTVGWSIPVVGFSGSATGNSFGSFATTQFSAAGTEKIQMNRAQVVNGTVATTYPPATTSAAMYGLPISYGEGLLVEPAATNVEISSQALIDGTNHGDDGTTSQTLNAATAPDGSTTATKFNETAGGTVHYMYTDNISFTSGTAYTLSVYAKAAERDFFAWSFAAAPFPDGSNAIYDLDTGVVVSAGGGATASIENVGDGWYRCIVTQTADATTNNVVAYNILLNGTTSSYSGTAGNGVYIWGGQVEVGTVATSYIPTRAASATRAADDPFVLVSAFPYGSAHTTYVSARTRIVTAAHDVLCFDANNANIDESVIFNTDTAADINLYVEDGGAAQTAAYPGLDTTVNAVADTDFQITGAWATNAVDVSADGVAPQNDASATMPTPTHLRLGCSPTPTNHLNGFIKKVIYVPRQVETEDADLENWRYTA